jgi:hypothetical protein
MPSEIGKWSILEADNEFVVFAFKCYLCKHHTIIRMPTEKLVAELKAQDVKIEDEANKLVSLRKKAKPDEEEPETKMVE